MFILVYDMGGFSLGAGGLIDPTEFSGVNFIFIYFIYRMFS